MRPGTALGTHGHLPRAPGLGRFLEPNLPYLVLPTSHYASQWATDREIRDCDDVTEVGMQYARETDPQKKQDLLLELVRYFHSYTFNTSR